VLPRLVNWNAVSGEQRSSENQSQKGSDSQANADCSATMPVHA